MIEIGLIDIHVPILETVTLSKFDTIEDILTYAEGKSLNPKIEREGLVFKSLASISDQVISFKVISNKFLLAAKE